MNNKYPVTLCHGHIKISMAHFDAECLNIFVRDNEGKFLKPLSGKLVREMKTNAEIIEISAAYTM